MKLSPLFIFAPGKLAGAERMVISALTALEELQMKPIIIIIKETRSPELADDFSRLLPDTIEKVFLTTTSATDFRFISQIKDFVLARHETFIVHTHGYKALFGTYSLPKSVKRVHTHHGNTSQNLKVKFYEFLAEILMKRCDHIFVLSKEMMRYFLGNGYKADMLTYTPNMLSLKNIKNLISERKSITRNEKRLNLLYLKKLSPEKGILFMIELFKDYEIQRNFKLEVVGDGIEREIAEKFVGNNKLEKSITFHGFQNDPIPYLLKADALVQPSLTEGMPMTLIESLALGIPVLANPVGAIPELIENHKNGLLTDIENSDVWKKALIELKNNYREIKETTESNQKEFIQNFSPNKWAKKTLEVYQNLK